MRKQLLMNRSARANSLDIYNASFWANEMVLAMEPELVAIPLVSQDFRPTGEFKLNDVVQIPRIGAFQAYRKETTDDVTVQDASSDWVPIALDQHLHVSFGLADGEDKRPVIDLVQTYAIPAARALARMGERLVTGQYVNFMSNMVGGLGTMTKDVIQGYLTDADQMMTGLSVPQGDRFALIGPTTKGAGLNNSLFVQANTSGSDAALRNSQLGKLFTFDTAPTPYCPSIAPGQTAAAAAVAALAVNDAAGFAKGTTVLTVDGTFAASTLAGMFVKIGGFVYRVTARDATHITITPGLKAAAADNAVIYILAAGAVKNAAGYRGTTYTGSVRKPGWSKYIATDGWTTAPQVGQAVTFAADSTNVYSIVDVQYVSAGVYNILVDRPLVAALADDDAVNLAPAGEYNLVCPSGSIAFVNRPLALPRGATGVSGAVIASQKAKMAIRVVVTYDGVKQRHLVTLDTLCGVGVANPDVGGLILG